MSFWELSRVVECAFKSHYKEHGAYPKYIYLSPKFASLIREAAIKDLVMKPCNNKQSENPAQADLQILGHSCLIVNTLPGISVCTYHDN